MSSLKVTRRLKQDPCQQFWFSRDLFSLLLTNLTVEVCFSLFPRLSHWHHSFMNARCQNTAFLKEWVKINHGVTLLITPHCTQMDYISKSFHHLIDSIFTALDECMDGSLNLSIILHHLFDSSLPTPDFEIPELYSQVCFIRAFQIDIQKRMIEEHDAGKVRISPMLRRLRKLDPSEEHFLKFLIEVLMNPLMLDPHQKSEHCVKLKEKVSRTVTKLIKIDPVQCADFDVLKAMLFSYYTSESLVTRNHCANGILRLLALLYTRVDVTQPVLDSKFLDLLTRDLDEHGCDVFEETIEGFHKVCECKQIKVSKSNIKEMIRFCVVAMNDCKPGRMFKIILDCFYLLSRDLIRSRLDQFVECGMFELLSDHYQRAGSQSGTFLEVRVISMLCLVCRYGSLIQFTRLKRMFPIITMIQLILNDDENKQRNDCVAWIYGYCIPLLSKDQDLLNELFDHHRYLITEMIEMGESSLSSLSSSMMIKKDVKLAENILICMRTLINYRQLSELQISVLIEDGVWSMLGAFAMSKEGCLKDDILECTLGLLDYLHSAQQQPPSSSSLSRTSTRKMMSYEDAKDVSDAQGISKCIYGYCKMRFECSAFLKRDPIKRKRFPTLVRHFPGVKPYLIDS